MKNRRNRMWVLWAEHIDPNTGVPLPWKKHRDGDLQYGKLRILSLTNARKTTGYLVYYDDDEIAYFVPEPELWPFPHYRCRNIDDVVAWTEAALPYIKKERRIKVQNTIAFIGRCDVDLEPWLWDESRQATCIAGHKVPHKACTCGYKGYFFPWEAWINTKAWLPIVAVIKPIGETLIENDMIIMERYRIVAIFLHVSWMNYAPKWVYRSPNPPFAAWKMANWLLKELSHDCQSTERETSNRESYTRLPIRDTMES